MNALKNSLRELLRYPSAIVGLAVTLTLVFAAAYALITIPYNEAIRLWRGGEDVWYQNPKFAPPAWMNLFSRQKLPESFVASSKDGTMTKVVTVGEQNTSRIDITYTFNYAYDSFPQEM